MWRTSGKIIKTAFLGGIVPAAVAILTCIIKGQPVDETFIVTLIIYIAASIVTCIVVCIYEGWFISRFDLWRIGKIRGLWKKRGLIKQIEQSFYESNVVKIKVTRGYDLLKKENEYGFSKILENLKSGKKENIRIKWKFGFCL